MFVTPPPFIFPSQYVEEAQQRPLKNENITVFPPRKCRCRGCQRPAALWVAQRALRGRHWVFIAAVCFSYLPHGGNLCPHPSPGLRRLEPTVPHLRTASLRFSSLRSRSPLCSVSQPASLPASQSVSRSDSRSV